ncbi:MAG: cation transporter [Muribaculaceae bacterium]|nr:cation transporter [Muribaculaceae bacterium]
MNREKEIYKVTLVGSAGNVALLTFKFIAGVVGHSSAMIADAVHSLSDFVTDLVVLAFVHVSAKPQDASHYYGHGKYETLASFLIGLALLGAALGILVSGGLKLAAWAGGEPLEAPGKVALWAALLSIAVKEALYRYTAIMGRRLDSPAVITNAWHHRSDALSSIGATLGIGGAIVLGDRWTVLDPIASMVVGVMLAKVAVGLLKANVNELTDGSLSAEIENEIIELITSQPGVSDPHNLRTRRVGNRMAIEVHVCMDGSTTLDESHQRTTMIEQQLKHHFGQNTLVTIHTEPISSL